MCEITKSTNSPVVCRFAPSPTGNLHIGGLRTALYAWLYAKQNNGKFILRIEDTDQSRCKPEWSSSICDILNTFGLHCDEIHYQSSRINIYQYHINRLISNGYVYICTCDKDSDIECRCKDTLEFNPSTPFCIKLNVQKFRNEMDNIVVYDNVRKSNITFEFSELYDIVLIKSDGYPSYHAASVIDDHFMGITTVFRGDEWISSLPYHSLLYRVFGWSEPEWFHLPLITNELGKKLSKRDGDVSVESFLDKLILKDAILNYVLLLGWHSSDNREEYTLSEMIDIFDVSRLVKSSSAFDIKKMLYLNGRYLDIKPFDDVVRELTIPIMHFNSTQWNPSMNIDELVKYYIKCKNSDVIGDIIIPPTDYSLAEFVGILNGDEYRVIIEQISNAIDKYISSKAPIDISLLVLMKDIVDLKIPNKYIHKLLRMMVYGKESGPDWITLFLILGDEFVSRFIHTKWFVHNVLVM